MYLGKFRPLLILSSTSADFVYSQILKFNKIYFFQIFVTADLRVQNNFIFANFFTININKISQRQNSRYAQGLSLPHFPLSLSPNLSMKISSRFAPLPSPPSQFSSIRTYTYMQIRDWMLKFFSFFSANQIGLCL